MIYFFTEKPASKSRRRATTDVEGLLERFGAVLSGDISADATEKENFYTALREGTKERGMVFMAWLQLIDIPNSFFAAHSYQGLKRGSPLS